MTIEPDEEPRQADAVDLMERLRRSLASASVSRQGRGDAKHKRTARKAAPKKRSSRAA